MFAKLLRISARLLAAVSVAILAALFTGTPQAVAAVPVVTPLSIDVQMPDVLVSQYGGGVQTRALVTKQLGDISRSFAGLDKPVRFSIKTFTVFSGPSNTRLGLTHSGAYLLVYSENAADPEGWFAANSAIGLTWPYGGGVFSPDATDMLRHEFGHTRGAVDVYATAVDAASNPVNGTSYTPPAGIMTYPYGTTTWDEYSRHVINAAGTTVHPDQPNPLVDKFFPSAMRVSVTSNGRAVKDASVQLYGVRWFTGSVEPVAMLSGNTGRNGNYKLTANPFKPYSAGYAWDMQYGNFLVKVTSGGKVGYAWLPVTTVGNWYFDHPGTAYTLNVKL